MRPDTETVLLRAVRIGENLLDFLMEGLAAGKGPALDVGCGLGANVRALARYYDPASEDLAPDRPCWVCRARSTRKISSNSICTRSNISGASPGEMIGLAPCICLRSARSRLRTVRNKSQVLIVVTSYFTDPPGHMTSHTFTLTREGAGVRPHRPFRMLASIRMAIDE